MMFIFLFFFLLLISDLHGSRLMCEFRLLSRNFYDSARSILLFFFILLNIVSMFVVDFIFIYCFAELSHSFKTLLMHPFVNQIFWKLYTFTFLFFFFFPRFTLVFLRCFLIVDGNLHGSTCPSFHSNISMRNGPL